MTAHEPTAPQVPLTGVRVVAAEGIDRRACRMLLPDTPGAVGWSQLLVAKDATTGSILGAAKSMPVRHSAGSFRTGSMLRSNASLMNSSSNVRQPQRPRIVMPPK